MGTDEYKENFGCEPPKEERWCCSTRGAGNASRRKTRHEEDDLEMQCVRWWDATHACVAPLLHHSPNEGFLRGGVIEGARRKKMGVRAGFPDLILLLPTRAYHYLAVELKTRTGRQSDTQKAYQRLVEAHGGLYVVARSVDEFIAYVNAYLEEI